MRGGNDAGVHAYRPGITDALTDFFYRWKKAKSGNVDPPPARFEYAVQEAFYWAEILDNGGNLADFGGEASPGLTAALAGLWRGRNKADNEQGKGDAGTSEKERQKLRERYSGKD
jgi:hypothetical protein